MALVMTGSGIRIGEQSGSEHVESGTFTKRKPDVHVQLVETCRPPPNAIDCSTKQSAFLQAAVSCSAVLPCLKAFALPYLQQTCHSCQEI